MFGQTEKQVDISDDGIAVFDGFFPPELCDRMIDYFKKRNEAGATFNRWTNIAYSTKNRDDTMIGFADEEFLVNVDMRENGGEFLNIFWNECYERYINKFFMIKDFGRHKIYAMNLQRTLPAEGYHVWHCEADGKERYGRLLVFILYLNDVEEAGETEFLYAKKRITPKKGRLVLWPTGFTHTHRGNPPLSGEKYILTGWVEF